MQKCFNNLKVEEDKETVIPRERCVHFKNKHLYVDNVISVCVCVCVCLHEPSVKEKLELFCI